MLGYFLRRASYGALFLSFLFSLLISLCLSSCSTYRYGSRSFPEVRRLAQENNFHLSSFQDSYATLLVASKHAQPEKLHLYIGGDGVAWRTSSEPSFDPTPLVPTTFRLATLDASRASVTYLSRPGQYLESPTLSVWDWTHRRFSSQTIALYNRYLDGVRELYPHAKITLLGYSGGGTIALLLAASRDDIARVVTFAGLLDTEKWVQVKRYSPLEGSLNPVNFTEKLSSIPQIHLVGSEDTVVTKSVVRSYLNHFSPQDPIQLETLQGVSHWSGWEDAWPRVSRGILASSR